MATITPVVTRPDDDTMLVIWDSVTENDELGLATGLSEHSDKTVQVIGDLGGGSIAVKGTTLDSTTPADFATMNDQFGSALTISSPSIKTISEHTPSILPVRTGGSSMNCKVSIRAKRSRR